MHNSCPVAALLHQHIQHLLQQLHQLPAAHAVNLGPQRCRCCCCCRNGGLLLLQLLCQVLQLSICRIKLVG
jgi:hypothetical protein